MGIPDYEAIQLSRLCCVVGQYEVNSIRARNYPNSNIVPAGCLWIVVLLQSSIYCYQYVVIAYISCISGCVYYITYLDVNATIFRNYAIV